MNNISYHVNSNIHEIYGQVETLHYEINSGNLERLNLVKNQSKKLFKKIVKRMPCTRDTGLENILIHFHETLKIMRERLVIHGLKKDSVGIIKDILHTIHCYEKISKKIENIFIFFNLHEKLKYPTVDPFKTRIQPLDSKMPLELKMALYRPFIKEHSEEFHPCFKTKEINLGFTFNKTKLDIIFSKIKQNKFNEHYDGETYFTKAFIVKNSQF